jgi:enoyl-CoA hydratase/carnithine racemase
VPSAELPALWQRLAEQGAAALPAHGLPPADNQLARRQADIERFFGLATVGEMVKALETDGTEWATQAAGLLRKRSPLMLHVTLEQVRRARGLDLAGDLRMERDIVHHCFHLRPGTAGETMEGIRALVIDKDHSPKWNPARIEDVRGQDVLKFFDSPWPVHAHPLRMLADGGGA